MGKGEGPFPEKGLNTPRKALALICGGERGACWRKKGKGLRLEDVQAGAAKKKRGGGNFLGPSCL